MAESELEAELKYQLSKHGFPEPEQDYKFHPTRKWMIDFAWPDDMIAVEVEGGIHSGGRHVRGVGYENDCEKYNAATLLGWRVFRFTGGMIKVPNLITASVAIKTLREAFDENRITIEGVS